MKLPIIAIEQHRFTLIIIFLLVALGIASLVSMPRSEDPQFEFPATMIRVVYPGTTPVDIEKLIVDPIEEAINELDDIKVLKSTIEDGLAVIQVEFLYGSDPQDKYDDVVSAIARIQGELPKDLALLSVDKISPVDVNILQVALVSDQQSYLSIKKVAEKLEKKLERVSGVKEAAVEALPEQQVHIDADLAKMRELGIALEDLIQAVQQSGANIPGGHTLAGDRRFTVRTSGDFRSLDEIKKTAVHSSPGSIVYVSDIANVNFGDELPTYEARYNGKKAVFISVVQREGTNIFNVLTGVKKELTRFEADLPQGVTIQLAHDQSESVHERVNGFFTNLLQGLLLVSLMVLLFLGFRSAIVVTLAIPISVLIGLSWLDFAGFGLQQMSITGLIIALGLLVDNAIVVTENVSRFLRQGYSPQKSASLGASQVGWAVASGTLTTVLAFIPILGLQTGSGTFLRSMPVTVILILIASLLVALTFTPLLASFILRHSPSSAKHTEHTPYLFRVVKKFAQGSYKDILTHALKHPWRILSIALTLLIASMLLAGQLGVSLFPKAEKPMIMVNIELAEGAGFEQTRLMAVQVEQLIKQYPLVRSISTNVGKDNPRIYYNIFPKRQVPNYAQLIVRLYTGSLSEVEPFITELRQQFTNIPGANITVKELLQGPPAEAPVSIRVIGDDLDQLLIMSRQVTAIVEKTPGTVNTDNPLDKPKMDLSIHINREKAAMMGVSIQAIDEIIRASLVGVTVSQFRDESGDDYPILVRSQGLFSESKKVPRIEDFDVMMVKSMTGVQIPLRQLVTLELNNALSRFQHHMTERMVRVTADIKAGYQAAPVTRQIKEQLNEFAWPKGISYQLGGEQEQRDESFNGMAKIMLIALLGIFAILVLQFNSFKQPVIIFAAIPFAVTGMVLALWLTGYTFSFTAFIGLTSLVGIVVNNSIILVDYANLLRKEGKSLEEAIVESGQTRLLPILLTSMTTIGGLLPLTLSGSVMWSPMGWAIIGGLLTSTLLTLLVVPVLYFLTRSVVGVN